MRYVFMLIVFLVAFSASYAFAQNQPQQIFNFPNGLQTQEYRMCTQSADCTSFNMPCAAPIAVNKRYLAVLQQGRASIENRYGCGVAKMNLVNVPTCLNGYCMFGAPQTITPADLSDPRFCSVQSDCTFVTNHCGQKFPVNRQNFAVKQSDLDLEQTTGCDWVENRPVKQTTCQFNRCTVTMDNYSGNGVQ